MTINEIHGMIQSVYDDWKKILVNPRFIRKNYEITWEGYESIFLDDPVRRKDVIVLSEKRQYSFQLVNDGSLLQLIYRFKDRGSVIESASLAYYSYASEIEVKKIGDDLEQEAPEYQDITDFPSWFRIDYELGAGRGIIHHDTHLHFSGFSDSRCIVKGVPTPQQFVEFVIAFCYPSYYEEHRLNEDGSYKDLRKIQKINEKIVRTPISNVYQHMIHFATPGV